MTDKIVIRYTMPNQRDPDKKMVGLWLKRNLRDQLQTIAEDENRSMSNTVETILKKYIQEKTKAKSRTKAV